MEFLFQLRGGVLSFARPLRRVFKYFGLGLLGLLGCLVALVLLILARPSLLINDHTLGVGAHLADRAGIHLSWDTGHVDVESPGFFEKRIKLVFTGLCVRMPSNRVDACFGNAELAAAGGLSGLHPRITEVGPVNLQGGRVSVAPEASAPYSEPPRDEPAKKGGLPDFLAKARILPIHIDIPSWKVLTGTTELAGRLGLESNTGSQGQAHIGIDLGTQIKSADSPGKQRFQAKIGLDNPKGFLTLDRWSLRANAQGALPDGTDLGAVARLDPRAGKGVMDYAYSVDASYAKGKGKASARASGNASPDRIEARVSGSALNLIPNIPRAWVHDCDLAMARQSSEVLPGALKVSCPVGAKVPVPPKGFPPVEMPTEVGVTLVADLKTGAYPPSPSAAVDGKVSVELDPVLTPIFQGGGKVESQVAGVPAEFPNGWKMDTDLGLDLKVTRFQRLVKQLANGPLDVWAPLRVLKGQVEVAVQGKFDNDSGTAPVMFQTRLHSQKQLLDLDGKGKLHIERLRPDPRMHLAMDLALTGVQLELPPLPDLPTPTSPKPDPLPRFFPDGRIHAPITHFEKAPNSMFSYDVSIRTSDQQPVKLLTPQIKAPIPVALNISLADSAPPSGSVRILKLPLELFHRDVQLDHVNLTLENPTSNSELDGKIEVPYTDYTISVLLLGSVEKPQVKFLSDPPLPDDQIIAVLIFGQPLDSLDADQQQSVGNSRAAFLSGALSLASLYYLSSVNIEAIDYDPTTHTASLRYRLAEGTSLNLSEGAGQSQPSVGVRKRLNKHFAITTTLNNPSETQTSRTVSTFLEWAYQY
jgi:hypothetical protein